MNLEALDAALRKGVSERSFATESGVPRTTLQYWRARRDRIEAAPAVVAFFESPEGAVFLERITLAAHFVMTLVGNGGIRLVSAFLEHAGLDGFIGCSYGTQQRVASEMLDLVTTYGEQEQARLAASMPEKTSTICMDETFPAGGQCLVAMEPVSGYILAEEYQEKRDAKTWDEVMKRATAGMRLKVMQVTSDRANALIRYSAEQNAHHSSDLFHVQMDITRAMGLRMSQRVRRAHKAFIASSAERDEHIAEKMAYEHGPRRPGRPPAFDKRIQAASEVVAHHQLALDTAKEQQARYTSAVHEISDKYHPYMLKNGEHRTADTLSDDLREQFTKLHDLASETGASKKAIAKVNKAQRVAPKMVQTLAFYHQQVEARVGALKLAQEQHDLLMDGLIPQHT